MTGTPAPGGRADVRSATYHNLTPNTQGLGEVWLGRAVIAADRAKSDLTRQHSNGDSESARAIVSLVVAWMVIGSICLLATYLSKGAPA